MRVRNDTTWRSSDIRAVVLACEAWLGLRGKWIRRVRVTYGRRGGWTGGHASNGGSIMLAPPAAVSRGRRWEHDQAGIGAWHPEEQRRVDADGAMLPEAFADFAWTVEHELLHVAGWDHRRMRREHHPAYRYREGRGPPKWAEGLRLRARLPRPRVRPPAGARAAAADARDQAALARWTTKLRLATTKVRKLRARIAARRRRLEKGGGNGGGAG